MIEQPVAHHNIVATGDQRQAMQRLRRIGLEPSDLAFSAHLLLGFDPESEHGGRDVEDIHKLCAQIDGISCVLSIAATEVEDCQSRAVT
jgi:hypothetical protein